MCAVGSSSTLTWRRIASVNASWQWPTSSKYVLATLVLFDRGYPAFWLFALLYRSNIQFCMRINANYSPAVEAFVRSGAAEQQIERWPGIEARQECRKKATSIEPVALRLVRVELNTGEVEVLITSLLDTVDYPQAIFADLYRRRWGIEESYKAVKWRVEIENFSGKSGLCVMQDFHAKVVTTNLTALLAHQAQHELPTTSRRRHRVRVNFSHAVARMKNTIVRLFCAPNRAKVLNAFVDLLRRTVEPIRPGRTFPRVKRLTPPRLRQTYKRCG